VEEKECWNNGIVGEGKEECWNSGIMGGRKD